VSSVDNPSIVVTRFAGGDCEGGDARADRDAVEMHGTHTAQRHPAAEFGAGVAEQIAQIPEQRHVGIAVEVLRAIVDGQRGHRSPCDDAASRGRRVGI